MARYIDTKKNLSEIENPVKNVDIGKAVDTSKNLTSLKTTSFGVLSNKSLEQLSSLISYTPVISFNEDTAMVTITCETVGSSIYYTLDGSTPSASKTKYTGAFSVDKSCTIKAIGVKSGLNNSAVSTLEVEYQGGGEVIPPNPPVIEEFEDMIKKSYSLTGRGTTDSLGFTFNEGDELANDVKSNNFILAKIKFSNFGGLGDTFVHDTPASVDIMNNRPEHAILVLKSNVQFYFSLADFTLWINNATSDETLASLTLIDVYGVGEDAINSMKQALASANITIDVYLES